MTAKEFKARNRFRNVGEKTCANCRWFRIRYAQDGLETYANRECLGNGRPFTVFLEDVSVCDAWERRRRMKKP